jgi:hypothetical protein
MCRIRFLDLPRESFLEITLLDTHLAQRPDYIGETDVLRTVRDTDVALVTLPYSAVAQDFVSHSGQYTAHNEARVKISIEFAYRASCGASPAQETVHRFLAAGAGGEFIFEIKIRLAPGHAHSSICSRGGSK